MSTVGSNSVKKFLQKKSLFNEAVILWAHEFSQRILFYFFLLIIFHIFIWKEKFITNSVINAISVKITRNSFKKVNFFLVTLLAYMVHEIVSCTIKYNDLSLQNDILPTWSVVCPTWRIKEVLCRINTVWS